MALTQRPIIIIGAGRSGTSLLDAVLGAHPEIAMFGEFEGTIDRLWQVLWRASAAEAERARRIEAIRREVPEPEGASDAQIFERVRELERGERQRVAGIIRSTLAELYGLARLPARYWGFKEIWAESGDWQASDTVFPDALYLHLVRHPYDFARSCADWRHLPFTAAQLHTDLAAWLRYLQANAARAATGRYCRLRYEVLRDDPQAALAPLFERLGLAWAPGCSAPFGRQFVPSARQSPLPSGIAASCDAVPGLARAMAELGYALPAEPAGPASALPAEPGAVSSIGAGAWRLNPPFQADQGEAWVVRLDMAPELARFEAVADTLEQPYRSPLRLFEDGVALGPAHSLHALIRGQGSGRFSHWGPRQILLFSASDKSDPNRNGRVYSISA